MLVLGLELGLCNTRPPHHAQRRARIASIKAGAPGRIRFDRGPAAAADETHVDHHGWWKRYGLIVEQRLGEGQRLALPFIGFTASIDAGFRRLPVARVDRYC